MKTPLLVVKIHPDDTLVKASLDKLDQLLPPFLEDLPEPIFDIVKRLEKLAGIDLENLGTLGTSDVRVLLQPNDAILELVSAVEAWQHDDRLRVDIHDTDEIRNEQIDPTSRGL